VLHNRQVANSKFFEDFMIYFESLLILSIIFPMYFMIHLTCILHGDFRFIGFAISVVSLFRLSMLPISVRIHVPIVFLTCTVSFNLRILGSFSQFSFSEKIHRMDRTFECRHYVPYTRIYSYISTHTHPHIDATTFTRPL